MVREYEEKKEQSRWKDQQVTINTLNTSYSDILFNHNDLSIWLVDTEYRLLEFNENFRKRFSAVYGVRPEIGMDLVNGLEHVDPEMGEEVKRWGSRYKHALVTQKPSHYEDSFYLKGDKHYTSLSIFPVVEGGKATKIACYAKNIDKEVSKRSEEVREREELEKIISQNLSGILEGTTDMVFAVDSNYLYTSFNKNHAEYIQKTYGRKLEVGDSLFDVIAAGHNLERAREDFRRAFAGEIFTTQYDLSYNEPLFVKISFYLNRDEFGETQGIIVFMKNITDDIEKEANLKRNRQLLSSINRNINEAIFRSTADQGLVYVNEGFLEMFGYDSKVEVFKLNPESLYKDLEERRRLVELIHDKDVLENEEVWFKRKDGSLFVGLINSILTTDEEGGKYFDGAVRNVTQIKKTREDLEAANERLTSMNQQLDRFVYTASHDLKAPLASISGLINIYRQEENALLKEEYVNLMEKSVQKLEGFIKEIVEYSRNERAELKIETFSIRGLIREIFENLSFLNYNNAVEKRFEVVGESEQITTDRSRLEAVIKNLVSNAINYSNKGQEHPYVCVQATVTDSEVQLEVSDNGIGISEENLPKVFDMFFREHAVGEGSGLGLYIVAETIEKLGGTVRVDSQLRKGTTFYITIPSHSPESEALPL